MQSTPKVLCTGIGQAERLPKALPMDVSERWIAKNEMAGEITLTPKPEQEPDALTTFITEFLTIPGKDEFTQHGYAPERPIPFEDLVQ